jgi:hypothetical protein
MHSNLKISIATFSGVTSNAVRINALLYESFFRLPAKAKTIIVLSIKTPKNKLEKAIKRIKLLVLMVSHILKESRSFGQ